MSSRDDRDPHIVRSNNALNHGAVKMIISQKPAVRKPLSGSMRRMVGPPFSPHRMGGKLEIARMVGLALGSHPGTVKVAI